MGIYFDFFINENQKFTITADMSDLVGTLKSVGNKENEIFFNYLKFITQKNQEFQKLRDKTKGMSKEDSTKFINEKGLEFSKEAKQHDLDFLQKNKGSFISDVVNLRVEKEMQNPPKVSDSLLKVIQYYYYKDHYFDDVNFKDERIIRTPFFADKVKRYFEGVIVQHPDTMIKELDKLFAKTTEGSLIYNLLLGHFTYKFESNKNMMFDKLGNSLTYEKVFVHLADKYICSGHAKGVYTEETVKAICERSRIVGGLLPGAQVADLYMIDTIHGKKVMKMGFDTCKSSKTISDLYYRYEPQLKPLYKTLYSVNAKYTVLVFWASDCGHCKTEIPKLKENLDKLKGKIDFKVFGVQTKDDYEEWRKFIIDKKLDFINVFDPMHLNNLKERFDITSTPVIYLLDKDKKIKAKKLASEQVVELLEMFEKIEKEQNKKQ
jgi:thiol-disulfide isomerase/thioredoxin